MSSQAVICEEKSIGQTECCPAIYGQSVIGMPSCDKCPASINKLNTLNAIYAKVTSMPIITFEGDNFISIVYS
jgi:hypothetical protein